MPWRSSSTLFVRVLSLESGEHPFGSEGGLLAYMLSEIDPTEAGFPLAGFLLMSGFLSAVTYSATFVWGGFMTGNWAQLFQSLPRLFEYIARFNGPDRSFHIADQQALTCILTFFFGILCGRTSIANLFGGTKTRMWLFAGTLFQAVCTAAAAIAIWQSGSAKIAQDSSVPAWYNTLTFVGMGFVSYSMGLQGAMGRHLNSPFGATVVLTSTFVELFIDPGLFLRQRVYTRDAKFIGCFALGLGAFVARALMWEIGDGETMGIGAALRVIIAFSWLFVPGKPREVEPASEAPAVIVSRESKEYAQTSHKENLEMRLWTRSGDSTPSASGASTPVRPSRSMTMPLPMPGTRRYDGVDERL